MKVTTEVEVMPIWFIKKWCKEECCEDSPLWVFIHRMIKDWELEEIRNSNKNNAERKDYDLRKIMSNV